MLSPMSDMIVIVMPKPAQASLDHGDPLLNGLSTNDLIELYHLGVDLTRRDENDLFLIEKYRKARGLK